MITPLKPSPETIAAAKRCGVGEVECAPDADEQFWLIIPRARGVLSPWHNYVPTISIMAAEITIIRRLR